MDAPAPPHKYCRMPHILSMNPVQQMVPRQRLPEAIIDGHAKGYRGTAFPTKRSSRPIEYPKPGYSKIHMLYRYGTSTFGTIAKSGRLHRHVPPRVARIVVNQSIWMEGDAQFRRRHPAACTSFERYDISRVGQSGGYIQHNTTQTQSPHDDDAAQVHRAAGQVEIGLRDIHRDPQSDGRPARCSPRAVHAN